MKLDVTQVLLNRDGTSLKDVNAKGEATEAKLRIALINALEAVVKGDERDAPIKKYERSKLADRIYENDVVELTVDEVALIKERVGKVFAAYVMKVIWDLLEQTE